MDERTIIKIVFGILLSIGAFVLFLLSYLLFYKYIVHEKRCTVKTKGVVKKYTLANRGGDNCAIHLPIVYYQVDGKEYKVVGPEYKFIVTTTMKSPMNKSQEAYKEENQILTINRCANSFVDVRSHLMAHLYPVGTELDVFYDPQKPKLAYVLRYCNKKWAFYVGFFSGMAILIIDLLTLILL